MIKHYRSQKLLSQRWFWSLLAFLLLMVAINASDAQAEAASEETQGNSTTHSEEEDEIEPERAALFPSFSLTIGVLSFLILSRYLHALPYTAIMFLIGTLMGVGVSLREEDTTNQLSESVQLWIQINGEVLLLIFLPGLIFKDAFGQNVHLFGIALGQCLIFAFPMVLAGTSLTALVAFYIFPYEWTFNLSMTFGAILSATDPVAVAALLEQVGAPPRLKTHIAGEALLNDGAAIVFYEIFKELYLYEIGIGGEDINGAEGVAIFFRKSLGAVAVGIFFGLGLLGLVYLLNRRFNQEENVVEVSATLAIAYLGYYVAEVVWKTSGVLATLTLGVMFRFLGRAMLNDAKLLDDFWTLVEHLLNTVLFTLGGTVWGFSLTKAEKEGSFKAKDWGYLILLYCLLTVIRLLLFSSAYPITSRIGLKTNWAETLFQVYGGLRGAVGIALALTLDNEMREATSSDDDPNRVDTRQLFIFVGGIAFMTLIINGVTAGPLLRKMGLADSTETREKIVRAYQSRFVKNSIDDLVRLLTQPRFKDVSFPLVKHHVPHLKNLNRSQLMEAVEKHKDTTRPEDYSPPQLKRIIPYLKAEAELAETFTVGSSLITRDGESKDEFDPQAHALRVRRVLRTKNRMRRRSQSTMRVMMGGGNDPLSLLELRGLFISILRAAYEMQIRDGELQDREFLAISLQASLDFAADAVAKGKPLQDWDYVHVLDGTVEALAKSFTLKVRLIRFVECIWGKRAHTDVRYTEQRLQIERALAFMAAHRFAQQFMYKEFEDADCSLSENAKVVFNESQTQYRAAQALLDSYPENVVSGIVSHKFCLILLNSGANYIAKLVENGLLKEQEAEHLVKEIEENIREVLSCNAEDHPGEVSMDEEEEQYRKSIRLVETP